MIRRNKQLKFLTQRDGMIFCGILSVVGSPIHHNQSSQSELGRSCSERSGVIFSQGERVVLERDHRIIRFVMQGERDQVLMYLAEHLNIGMDDMMANVLGTSTSTG